MELGSEKRKGKQSKGRPSHCDESLVFYVIESLWLPAISRSEFTLPAAIVGKRASRSERRGDDMKFRQDGLVPTSAHRQQVLHASILHCIRHAGNRQIGRQAMELTASCCPGVLDAKALGRVGQGSRSSPNCSNTTHIAVLLYNVRLLMTASRLLNEAKTKPGTCSAPPNHAKGSTTSQIQLALVILSFVRSLLYLFSFHFLPCAIV